MKVEKVEGARGWWLVSEVHSLGELLQAHKQIVDEMEGEGIAIRETIAVGGYITHALVSAGATRAHEPPRYGDTRQPLSELLHGEGPKGGERPKVVMTEFWVRAGLN